MSSEPIDVLRKYLNSIERLDADGCLSLFAEDAVVQTPLLPEGAPTEIKGKANFSPAFRGVFGGMKSLQWVSSEVNTTNDPELVVARQTSNAVLQSGAPYKNDYAIFVRVRDGKIIETTEYFDVVKAAPLFAPGATVQE